MSPIQSSGRRQRAERPVRSQTAQANVYRILDTALYALDCFHIIDTQNCVEVITESIGGIRKSIRGIAIDAANSMGKLAFAASRQFPSPVNKSTSAI
jgi:hypothetical protein